MATLWVREYSAAPGISIIRHDGSIVEQGGAGAPMGTSARARRDIA